MFGPVGNSKAIFLVIHLLYILYEYPLYISKTLPNTWKNNFWLNISFLLSTFLMWLTFYLTHLTEPGYLETNTLEYQSTLRKVIIYYLLKKKKQQNFIL